MPEPAVHKNVGKGLPEARGEQVRYGPGDQTEPLQHPDVNRRAQQLGQGLHQENAAANEDEKLDARRDKAAPIEVVAARAVRATHECSLRCQAVAVKAMPLLWSP